MTMPDPLESLSDGELSETLAREVAGWKYAPSWKHGPGENPHMVWFDETGQWSTDDDGYPIRPRFATSADAVMPWLEKYRAWSSSRHQGGNAIVSIHRRRGEFWEGIAPTFARAACIALIRSARATQQDCGVRE